jgi:hypothetical protein
MVIHYPHGTTPAWDSSYLFVAHLRRRCSSFKVIANQTSFRFQVRNSPVLSPSSDGNSLTHTFTKLPHLGTVFTLLLHISTVVAVHLRLSLTRHHFVCRLGTLLSSDGYSFTIAHLLGRLPTLFVAHLNSSCSSFKVVANQIPYPISHLCPRCRPIVIHSLIHTCLGWLSPVCCTSQQILQFI